MVEADGKITLSFTLAGPIEDADALIVVGDFNARPDEPAYARMRAAGFRSAHAEANGMEPAVTWPSTKTEPFTAKLPPPL